MSKSKDQDGQHTHTEHAELRQTTSRPAPRRPGPRDLRRRRQDFPAEASRHRPSRICPTPPGSSSNTSASPSATSSTSPRRPPAATTRCSGPKTTGPSLPSRPPPHAWDHSIAAIRADLENFEALITKPDADLFKPFRWGNGQNLLREALLIADHTAYHLGELIVLRRLLGIWHK